MSNKLRTAHEGRQGPFRAGDATRREMREARIARGRRSGQQRPASHADRLGTRAGLAAGRAAHRKDEVEIAVNYGGDTACGTKGVIGRLGRLVTSTQSYRTSPVPYVTCGGHKGGPKATDRPPRAVWGAPKDAIWTLSANGEEGEKRRKEASGANKHANEMRFAVGHGRTDRLLSPIGGGG